MTTNSAPNGKGFFLLITDDLLIDNFLRILLQGSSIYSDTAAANYGSRDFFGKNLHIVPAKRFGTTEEVRKLSQISLKCCAYIVVHL